TSVKEMQNLSLRIQTKTEDERDCDQRLNSKTQVLKSNACPTFCKFSPGYGCPIAPPTRSPLFPSAPLAKPAEGERGSGVAGKQDGVGEGATGSRNTSGSETCVRNFDFMWVSRFAF
ncbi:hypothetical protein IRJ41_024391, partial [Triplophysa rosa]